MTKTYRVNAGQVLERRVRSAVTGAGQVRTRARGVGPAGSVIPAQLWDYQTGNLSQWFEQHSARPEQVAVLTGKDGVPTRPGYPYTARYTVAPGDHTFGQTEEERGEMASTAVQSGSPAEGVEQWYAWSTYFPEDFGLDPENVFFAYTQWHHSGLTGVPNIGFLTTRENNPSMLLTVRGGTFVSNTPSFDQTYAIGALPRGQWLDHKVYIKWSSDPTVGRVGVWVNGVQRFAPTTPMPTLYVGQTAYLKQGIYRGNSERTHTVYHTGTRRGSTEQSVVL